MAHDAWESLLSRYARLGRRRHPRRWQFRLSTLLLATTLFCVLCIPAERFGVPLVRRIADQGALMVTHLWTESAAEILPWMCGAFAVVAGLVAACLVYLAGPRWCVVAACVVVCLGPILFSAGMGLKVSIHDTPMGRVGARHIWSVLLPQLSVMLPLGAMLGWQCRPASEPPPSRMRARRRRRLKGTSTQPACGDATTAAGTEITSRQS